MKYLLLILCLLCAVGANAQASPSARVTPPYHYCALVVDDRRFSSPDRLQLDYGQSAPGAIADLEMTEMAQNIRASHSVIDVLNYLARHGWELFNVTTVQTQGRRSSLDNTTSYVDSETRYLLRRRTP
ncbi:hypothetical protein GO988_17375 [Hymenobacter sp. HMF4947]|uniref:DUF4177 domain-containing protein n=1 Tax=Hymenobacter ginkgonis TaxID=2682976 RepID=A0A7K1TIB4_9BACT|nr:hypothetical protein [Hymenobacter ginkgonis]MVN78103.1 hypothetical protein [Hymenobacter ginkgonis]